MSIAWDYLDPEKKAQLLHCRPDLRQLAECALCHSSVPVNELDEQCRCEVCRLMLEKVKEE